jgi:SAM-dependent methyltransferase
VVALALAPSFGQVVGLDPEESMLAEARAAAERSADGARPVWVQGRAEDVPGLALGTFRAVTLGQSFHWTDREAVIGIVYDCLDPGGAMVLIHHVAPAYEDSDELPLGPPHPPIPHDLVDSVLVRYLERGKPPRKADREPYADQLARTRFGRPERLVLPGRADLVRSVDDVIDNYLSTSFAAPDLFGARLREFRSELTDVLAQHTKTGFFWEWPGDTEVLVAVKGAVTAP